MTYRMKRWGQLPPQLQIVQQTSNHIDKWENNVDTYRYKRNGPDTISKDMKNDQVKNQYLNSTKRKFKSKIQSLE